MRIPQVSVIIPTFNDCAYIVETVSSVMNQTWKPVEIIVVDDGSNDNTALLLEPFRNQIIYLYQSNQGRSAARNKGISTSTGDYIAFLDADDIWYPTKLEEQLQSLHLHTSAHWSYHKTRLVNETGKEFKSNFWPEYFGTGTTGVIDLANKYLSPRLEISTSTVIVRRNLFRKVGLFEEVLMSGEDTEMWARLADASPVVYAPSKLATRRISTNTTFLERWTNYESSKYWLMATLSALKKLRIDPRHESQILGDTYRHSALLNFNVGNISSATEQWNLSRELLGTKYFRDTTPSKFAQFAISAARYHTEGPLMAERILRNTLSMVELPPEQISRSKAELFAGISHIYQLKKNKRETRHYARKALLNSRRLWTNIGLWKKSFRLIG